jgi:hypothetical protein
MPRAGIPRPEILAALLSRIRQGAPVLLTGPPGAGKTTLLIEAEAALEQEGWTPVYLDLMGAASTPEGLVEAALDALPAERFADRLPRALEIRALLAGGRARGAAAVQSLFALWATLDQAGGRPVALLLDEATEIRSLAYYEGLREVAQPFAAALARRRGTVLATSFPSLARQQWSFEALAVGPLSPAEVAARYRRLDAAGLCRYGFGISRYVRILGDATLESGESIAATWAREMAPGGRLEQACRHTYETLLLRSRGYGISKALLGLVAEAEGQNLTAIYRRLGRSPGATRDYLGWLLLVDALRMVKKRYYYVDGLLREWVRLYCRGRMPAGGEIAAAAAGLAKAGEATPGARRPRPRPLRAGATA